MELVEMHADEKNHKKHTKESPEPTSTRPISNTFRAHGHDTRSASKNSPPKLIPNSGPPSKEVQTVLEPKVKPQTSNPVSAVESSLHAERMQRAQLYQRYLHANVVDINLLSRHARAYGIPSMASVRARSWKLFCKYFPVSRADYDIVVPAHRQQYWKLVGELDIDPHSTSQPESTENDHPLNTSNDSVWGQFFSDENLKAEIRRDVQRTHSDIHRFRALEKQMLRILFIYARRHRDISYRQGMNELLAPFLFVFSETSLESIDDVEADSFFCFCHIMKGMRHFFDPKLRSVNGGTVEQELVNFEALVSFRDPQIARHFERIGVDVRYYALRWFRLWFSHELDLASLLTLWDSILASDEYRPSLHYLGLALLVSKRHLLLNADFTETMKLLLNSKVDTDVHALMRLAQDLRWKSDSLHDHGTKANK